MSSSTFVVIAVLSASFPDHTRHGVPGAVALSHFEQLEIPCLYVVNLYTDSSAIGFLDDGLWIIHCGPSLQCKDVLSFDYGFVVILDPIDVAPEPLIQFGIVDAIFFHKVVVPRSEGQCMISNDMQTNQQTNK